MKHHSNRYLLLLTTLLLCLMQACAPLPPLDSSDNSSGLTKQAKFSDQHLNLVVNDLITAMVQVYELGPLTTTVQVSEPRGSYGRKLVEALIGAGYGIQYVTADQGDFYLSYQNRTIQSDSRDIRDFTVRVGDIELQREYDVIAGNVVPTSVIFIRGSSSFNDMILNTGLFLQQSGEFEFLSGAEFTLSDASVRTTSLERIENTADVDGGDDDETSEMQPHSVLGARDWVLNTISDSLLEKKKQYPPLRKAQLTLSDDTLVLGRNNKNIIKALLDQFDHERDALFISACPFGDDSQEHADQHVTRIKEELILYKVAASRIVEEGCDKSEYPDGKVTSEHSVIMAQRRLVGNLAALNNTPTTLERYPSRALQLTVPHEVGGSTDIQARIITMLAAQEDTLGQSIVAENRPGESGRKGWTWFVEVATESGYDMSTYNIPDFIAQSIEYSAQYNIDTLEPIVNWGADPVVLAVPSNSRFRDIREFLSYAKGNPGQLSVSGGGEFISHHIALLQLQKATSLSLNYVPGENTEDALNQVLDGSVMSGFTDLSSAIRMADKLRILAIADIKRSPALRRVPTFLEMGIDIDDASVNYRGLMVPKGTPPEIIETLSEAALRMISHSTVAQRMREAGAPLKIMGREQTQRFWEEKQKTLSRFFKATDL